MTSPRLIAATAFSSRRAAAATMETLHVSTIRPPWVLFRHADSGNRGDGIRRPKMLTTTNGTVRVHPASPIALAVVVRRRGQVAATSPFLLTWERYRSSATLL